MKVELIRHTHNAVELLLFTKNTRLEMSPSLMADIISWPEQRKMEELEYMARTIPSSWEFVDYVFLITDVTRAFTHQFVRTRQGSYAQQTMRILNVADFGYATGPSISKDAQRVRTYREAMTYINATYTALIKQGAEVEDARGLLPTNIHTNIVAKFNLRTLSEMKLKRSGVRSQGEYRDVLQMMLDAVYNVHPWAQLFLEPKLNDTVVNLERLAAETRPLSLELSNRIQKEADMLKTRVLA